MLSTLANEDTFKENLETRRRGEFRKTKTKLQESLVEISIVILVERRCTITEAIMLSDDGYICG
jgi:hypothetical protein